MTMTSHPQLSHFGVMCKSLDTMIAFYSDVFGMQVTDRGMAHTMPFEIAFLSGSPLQHHQLALASGRSEAAVSTVMQISFKVQTLEELRNARQRALDNGADAMRGLNHGNALSIYYRDPEGNTVEVYLDTPWYVSQPHGDPLDLDVDDDQIWAETERICRSDPTFMPIEQWRSKFQASGKR
jgi:catechol 2,3-dioxygenase